MKFAIALSVLLISASIATANTLQSESHERRISANGALSRAFSSGLTTVSVRTWKESALEKARSKLYALKKESRRIKAIIACRKKKSNMLRALQKKKNSFSCAGSMNRSGSECRQMGRLRHQLKSGRKRCGGNKRCMKKHVWPVQSKLKKLTKACNCKKGDSIMKMIWKTKKIRCGKGRKAWMVKRDMRKVRNRISYLQKTMMVKPSVAPRPKRG